MKRLSSILAVGAVACAGSAFATDTIFWGIDNGADTIGTFSAGDPGTFNPIGTTGITDGFVNSLEFDGNGTLYASSGVTLYTIDRGTGAATAVGPHGDLGGESISDFTWDGSTMWAVGTICGVQSSLYNIDLTTGAATFVCTTDLAGSCDVGLALGGDGTLFGHDIVNDVIYSVDPGTCVTSTVVNLPFDTNFGQGLTASPDVNFHVAFNSTAFQGELHTFDAAGNYDFLGVLGPLQIAGADVEVAEQACLGLDISNLVGGETAFFDVSGGEPGQRTAVLWGTGGEPSVFEDVNDWCATFGFDVRLKGRKVRIVGSAIFNDDGLARVRRVIPADKTGLDLLFQAAERGTCPGECMSDVVPGTIG